MRGMMATTIQLKLSRIRLRWGGTVEYKDEYKDAENDVDENKDCMKDNLV